MWHTEPGLTAFLSRSQNYSLIKKTCPSHPTVCTTGCLSHWLHSGFYFFSPLLTFSLIWFKPKLNPGFQRSWEGTYERKTHRAPIRETAGIYQLPECNPLERHDSIPSEILIFNNLPPSTSPKLVSAKFFPISCWMEEKWKPNCSAKGCSYPRGYKSSEMQVPKENGSSLLHGISNDSSNSVHFLSKDDQYSLRSLLFANGPCLQRIDSLVEGRRNN